MHYRIEKDTMGEVQVPSEKYWGAQTERSRNNFKIGPSASMPKEIIEGFAWRAIAWQCAQGVEPKIYPAGSWHVPPDMTHPKIGEHQKINEYLTNYIQERKLLA